MEELRKEWNYRTYEATGVAKMIFDTDRTAGNSGIRKNEAYPRIFYQNPVII